MSQVTIRRPFGELDLCDQLRFEPHTVFHLFLGQGPLGPFLLGQVGKRAGVDLQSLEPARHLTANLRHKAVPHLGGVEEPLALVIADDQRIKRIPRRVAADNKLLPTVDLVLDPCAGSLAGLVNGILALGDDALEAELLCDPDQLGRIGVKAL